MPDTALARQAPRMELGSLADPAELGRMLAASGYFADATEAAQAVVKVLAGAELGFGPIASMTGVYIVKGRVTLSANLMAAAIKRHPRYDYRIREHTDTAAAVEFYERADGERVHVGTSEFTMAMAATAGLTGGENWKKYPSNMLLWRAMSNGAKFFCPDAFAGAPIYTPDELGADTDPETGELLPPPDAVGYSVDRKTGEVREHAPRAPETPSAPPEPPPGPRPVSAAPEPPAAAPAPEAAADEGAPLDNAEFAKLLELLDALKVPEGPRRMAAIGYGVDDLAQLTRGQARQLADTMQARFGS